MGASAIGVPGWPEFAFCTASIDRVRIVSMQSLSRACLSVAADVMSLPLRLRLSSIPLTHCERVLLLGQQAGSDHAGVRPSLCERNLEPLKPRRERAATGLLDRGVEEEIRRGSAQATADDDPLRLEHVHEVRDADPEPAAKVGQVAERDRVTGARGFLDLLTRHARGPLEGAARAVGLDAPAVGAGRARAGQTVELDDHVAELGA